MKKYIVVFFLSTIGLFYSQNNELEKVRCSKYNEDFNNAKLKYNKGLADISVLDSLLQNSLSTNSKPLSVDLFFALKVYATFCKEDRFLSISSKLISNGINLNTILKEVPACIDRHKIFTKLKQVELQKKSPEVSNILNNIYKEDKRSQSIIVNNKSRELINNNNYNELISLIKKLNKWPGITVSGVDYNISHNNISADFTQALLHFNTSQIEEILPYLIDAVNDNELSPYHFAKIYDYYMIKKTTIKSLGLESRQSFGTYKTKDGKSLFPVDDIVNLQTRRKNICLTSEILDLK